MGKTRELFKKIRDTRRTFHAKMGTIKYRNGVDVTEAEDLKKRWQSTKETISRVKRQPSEWEKIIANEAADKELISQIYKQLLQLNSRKISDPIKK